jgi:GNAT superfamily N-acetyltransferase
MSEQREWVAAVRAKDLGPYDWSRTHPTLPADAWSWNPPDWHWVLLSGGQPVAACSLWWREVPKLDGQPIGFIGHYQSHASEAGRPLLRRACQTLADHDCRKAVGPVDGHTWGDYRFITDRGREPSEPPFFLEPDHDGTAPGIFAAEGFLPLAEYVSAIHENLDWRDPKAARAWERFPGNALKLRTLNAGQMEEELRSVFEVTLSAFLKSFLYTPIRWEAFLRQCQLWWDRVDPELVLIAEWEGRPAGFLFGVPDWNQTRRGQVLDTAIIKTLAVQPGAHLAGLGSILTDRFHQRALELGYRRVIHALMHRANRSTVISKRTARVFRRYAVFSRDLLR